MHQFKFALLLECTIGKSLFEKINKSQVASVWMKQKSISCYQATKTYKKSVFICISEFLKETTTTKKFEKIYAR